MTPRDLFQALLARREGNPTALAKAMDPQGKPTLQPTISRYLHGTKNPRTDWLAEVAAHWKLPPDTFSSSARATEVAAQHNIQAAAQDAEPPHVVRIKPRPGIDPGVVVELIAELARDLAPVSREAAAALLAGAMKHPDDAPSIAISLRGLLSGARKASNG
jgi:hypothetical protein